MRQFVMERHHVELREACPIVEAVVLDGVASFDEMTFQRFFGADDRHSVARGVALRQPLVPQHVVVVEIEQCAVHVEQHGIDVVPLNGR